MEKYTEVPNIHAIEMADELLRLMSTNHFKKINRIMSCYHPDSEGSSQFVMSTDVEAGENGNFIQLIFQIGFIVPESYVIIDTRFPSISGGITSNTDDDSGALIIPPNMIEDASILPDLRRENSIECIGRLYIENAIKDSNNIMLLDELKCSYSPGGFYVGIIGTERTSGEFPLARFNMESEVMTSSTEITVKFPVAIDWNKIDNTLSTTSSGVSITLKGVY